MPKTHEKPVPCPDSATSTFSLGRRGVGSRRRGLKIRGWWGRRGRDRGHGGHVGGQSRGWRLPRGTAQITVRFWKRPRVVNLVRIDGCLVVRGWLGAGLQVVEPAETVTAVRAGLVIVPEIVTRVAAVVEVFRWCRDEGRVGAREVVEVVREGRDVGGRRLTLLQHRGGWRLGGGVSVRGGGRSGRR